MTCKAALDQLPELHCLKSSLVCAGAAVTQQRDVQLKQTRQKLAWATLP